MKTHIVNHRIPTAGRIERGSAEKLYELEHTLSEALKAVAEHLVERAKRNELPLGSGATSVFGDAYPQAFYDQWGGYEAGAVGVAVLAWLVGPDVAHLEWLAPLRSLAGLIATDAYWNPAEGSEGQFTCPACETGILTSPR